MKQRMIISLEPQQMAILKRLSSEKDQSISGLIREAVEVYTRNQEVNSPRLMLQWLDQNNEMLKKAFKRSDQDLSQDIDKLLYGQK